MVTAPLAERLRSGEPLVGTVLSLPGVALAELASAPFDLVWIDLEHGALGVGEAQELVVGAQGAGCAAAIRVPRWDWERLPAVLDARVDGVVAPGVEKPAEAAALAARLRHPPDGRRGYGPRRGVRRSSQPALLVQIESAAAVEAAPAIAAVPAVDALVVGAADLSFDLGAPLDLDAVAPAAAAVREAARVAGIGFGVAGPGSPEALARLAGDGPALLVGSVDVRLFATAVDAFAAALRAAASAGRREDGRVVA